MRQLLIILQIKLKLREGMSTRGHTEGLAVGSQGKKIPPEYDELKNVTGLLRNCVFALLSSIQICTIRTHIYLHIFNIRIISLKVSIRLICFTLLL
ncbi:hypothetical protein CEXT_24851 [Caerostris extrusa]|uniref:Uncharacterized protein n=1 Tax=Caerostris extrusa TaxID=172846 RepID=A0AAV4UFQ1_CAEEX|nr:hypothetical protein CEXT_24851 [Caerostris extrusa]